MGSTEETSAQKQSLPKVRRVPGLALSAAQEGLLERAFAGSREIFVEAEFRSGYSGATILLVSSDSGQAHLIVKLGHPAALQREYTAYRQFVESILPQNTARLQGEPLLADDGGLALLTYTFTGGDPRLPTRSLEDYYHRRRGRATAYVLDRVFRIYGRRWWADNRPRKYVLGEQYDRLLPVHLKFKPTPTSGTRPRIFPADQLDAAALRDIQPGQPIRLQGFCVSEVRPDRCEVTLTVAPPPGEAAPPLRLRLETDDATAYQPGDQLETHDAIVTATRNTLLAEIISLTVPAFEPDAVYLNLGGHTYPNPLLGISSLMNRTIEGKESVIHGDLNLQNILVDHDTGFAWLIDFAETRRGPTLFDLQRLEGQVITKLLASTAAEAGLEPAIMPSLLESLHNDLPQPILRLDRRAQAALQEIYTVLITIRHLARQYLMDDQDWDEYYLGLIISLLGTLKFPGPKPLARELALVGAVAARELLETSPPKQSGYRILVVEDQKQLWQVTLHEILVGMGCLVEIAETYGEALDKLQNSRFDLVTLDVHLGQDIEIQEGILLLEHIRNRFGPAFPVIIVSAAIYKRNVVRAFKQFSVADVFLKEYFERELFREAVRNALQAPQL